MVSCMNVQVVVLPNAVLLERPCVRQIVDVELHRLSKHLAAMRARLLDILVAADLGDGVKVHGPRDQSLRLPNTLSIGIPGVEARVLLEKVGYKANGVSFLVLGSIGEAVSRRASEPVCASRDVARGLVDVACIHRFESCISHAKIQIPFSHFCRFCEASLLGNRERPCM